MHSAEDYDSCIAPLRRLWPNPLLRFTIFDETPHKAPHVASERLSLHSVPTIPLSETTLPSPVVHHHSCILPPSPPPLVSPPSHPLHPSATCIFLPPSPPSIILSPTSSKSCSPQECGTAETAPCCPVAKAKEDIGVLLSSFKDDLERILCRTFGTGYAEKQSAPFVKGSISRVSGIDDVPPQTEALVSDRASTSSRWCFVCRTSFTGVWYGCIKCPWHAVVSRLLENLD